MDAWIYFKFGMWLYIDKAYVVCAFDAVRYRCSVCVLMGVYIARRRVQRYVSSVKIVYNALPA